MKIIEKHFPANITMKELTFLNNKNIDGRLYGYLQSKSMPIKVANYYETRVDKFQLGTQADFCEAIQIKSPKTLRKHLKILIDTGYLRDEQGYYVLVEKENIYFKIPLQTLRFIQNTIKEDVIKIYIYLGQRYQYAATENKKYSFSIREIIEHLGLSVNDKNRSFVKDGLDALMNNGLIKFVNYREGKVPRMRLVDFTYEYKTNFKN